jgi:hypothetical protein
MIRFIASVTAARGSFSLCASSAMSTLISSACSDSLPRHTRTAYPSNDQWYYVQSHRRPVLIVSAHSRCRLAKIQISTTERGPSLNVRIGLPDSILKVAPLKLVESAIISLHTVFSSRSHYWMSVESTAPPTFLIREFGQIMRAVGQCLALISALSLRIVVFRRW